MKSISTYVLVKYSLSHYVCMGMGLSGRKSRRVAYEPGPVVGIITGNPAYLAVARILLESRQCIICAKDSAYLLVIQ